jgi:hypothetical protein
MTGAMHEAMSAQVAQAAIRASVLSARQCLVAVGRACRRHESLAQGGHDALLQRHTNRLAYARTPVLWRPEVTGSMRYSLHLLEPGEEHRLVAQSNRARRPGSSAANCTNGCMAACAEPTPEAARPGHPAPGPATTRRAHAAFPRPWSRRWLNAVERAAANEAAGIRRAPALLAILLKRGAVYSAGGDAQGMNSLNAADVHPYYVITDMTASSRPSAGCRPYRPGAGSDAAARRPAPDASRPQLHMLRAAPRGRCAESVRKPADPSIVARLSPPTAH